MKEATGELNATLIVVITIGLLSNFFFTVIWPTLKNNLNSSTKCGDAYCPPVCPGDGGKCKPNCADNECKTVNCVYKGKQIVCPYKG